MNRTIQLYVDKQKKVKGYPLTSVDRVIDEDGVSIKKHLKDNVKFDVVGEGVEVPEIDGKYDDSEIEEDIENIKVQLDSIALTVSKEIVIDEYTVLTNKNIIFNGGFFNINSILVLNNCNILCDNINFKGTGELRGILKNESIPYENIDVPSINLELAKNRYTQIEDGLVYVDSILGLDTNNGTTKNTPVQSLNKAFNVLQTLNTDGKVILRSGRYDIKNKITYSGTRSVTIKPNYCEEVEVGNELVFINKLGSKVNLESNGRLSYSHNENEIIYNLFSKKGTKLKIASSKRKGLGYEVRNRAEGLITHDGSNPLLKCKSDIYKKLDTIQNDLILNGIIIQWRNYGVTWSKILGYDSTEKKIKYWSVSSKDGNKAGDSIYKNTQGKDIPYILENLEVFADEENYFSTMNKLYLPNDNNTVYFYPKINSIGFDFSNSTNLSIKNIKFNYVMPSLNNLSDNQQTGSANHPKLIGYLIGDNVNNFTIENCVFEYLSIMCGYLIGNRNKILNSKLTELDSGGFVLYGNNTYFQNNECYNLGKVLLMRGAITSVGKSCNVSSNKIKRFTQCAIRFGEDFCDKYEPLSFECYWNEISYMCMDEEMKAEEDRFLVDGGAIYWWGRNKNGTYSSANVYENVIYNITGEGHNNGLYADGRPSNSKINRNLIFNVGSYALDLIDPGAEILENCTVNDNFFVGPVRFEGKNNAGNSFNVNNIIANVNKAYLKNVFKNITLNGNTEEKCYRKIQCTVEKESIGLNKAYLKTINPNLSAFPLSFIKNNIQIPTGDILGSDGGFNKVQQPNWGTGWSGTLRCYKDALGIIHLEGDCNGDSTCGQKILTLPEAYRPYNKQYVVAYTKGGGLANLEINKDGSVVGSIWRNVDFSVNYPKPTTIYLDNISFRGSYEDPYYNKQ